MAGICDSQVLHYGDTLIMEFGTGNCWFGKCFCFDRSCNDF